MTPAIATAPREGSAFCLAQAAVPMPDTAQASASTQAYNDSYPIEALHESAAGITCPGHHTPQPTKTAPAPVKLQNIGRDRKRASALSSAPSHSNAALTRHAVAMTEGG